MKFLAGVLVLAAVSAVALPQDPAATPPPPDYGVTSASLPATDSTDVAPGTAATDSASLAPTDSVSVMPTDSASVAPIDSASLVPTDSASVVPLDASSADQSPETSPVPVSTVNSADFSELPSSFPGTDVFFDLSSLATLATSAFDAESALSALVTPVTPALDTESAPTTPPTPPAFDSASAAEEESAQPSTPTPLPLSDVPTAATDGAATTDLGAPTAVGTAGGMTMTMTSETVGIPSVTPPVRRRWAWF